MNDLNPSRARDAFKRRMEEAAERLLEGPMRRQRWAVVDRDNIAEMLEQVVRVEDDIRTGRRGLSGRRVRRDHE